MISLNKFSLKLIILTIGFSASLSLQAFEINSNGSSWNDAQAIFHTMPVSTTGSDGLTALQLQDAFGEAMDAWSDVSAFNLIKDDSPSNSLVVCPSFDDGEVDLANPDNNDNVFTFGNISCFGAFGANTLGFTRFVRNINTNFIVQSSITFNSAVNWDIYNGPQLPSGFDFRRTAVHELGHSLALEHTDVPFSIMEELIGITEVPQTDDLAGIEFLYGPFVPPIIPPIIPTNPIVNISPILFLLLSD